MATKLDTISHYQTPEGIELSLSLAGPMARGMAWIIDFAIRVGLYFILAIIVGLLGGLGTAIILISLFIIEWFYPVFFEVHNGMTPGKKVMGLQVVHDDGTPVSWTSSLLRNLIRCIDLLPLFYMAGFITMLLNPRFKRLGDIAAGTLVVYHRDATKVFTIPDHPAAPAPVPLRLEEQRLVLDFCERSGTLSEQRRYELALFLNDITGGETPENRLLAYGNWFLRGKGNSESKSI